MWFFFSMGLRGVETVWIVQVYTGKKGEMRKYK
jgi:hypothetical protein